MTPLLCGFHEGWQCWLTGRKSKYLARNPTLSRVYYLATVEWSGFLSGSSLSTLALKQQQTITFHLLLAVVLWQLHEPQMELLPCTASSTGTWVNQLATLVQQLGWCRTTTFSYLESLGTLLAGIAMSLWRSTERYEDCIFWKRSVSLSFLGVFLCCVCLGCVCVWGLFCFDFGRHLAFCFSPVLEQRENSWSTTRRFDDRPSLERARHELKRKTAEWNRIARLRQQGSVLVFPSEEEGIFSQVRHEEGLIALCYRGPHQKGPSRGTKRRKQDTP